MSRRSRPARLAIAIEKLQANIKELKQEIERVGVSKNLDSKISSKPPSSDLLKKSEKKKSENEPETNKEKRSSWRATRTPRKDW